MQLTAFKNSHVQLIDYTKELAHPSVKAYFSTRYGGVSSGKYGQLNLGRVQPDDPSNIAENMRLLCAVLPKKARRIYADQVHGTAIYLDDGTQNGKVGKYDGFVSNRSDVLINTYHADCYPIYAAALENTWYGVAHSGWRGTYDEITQSLVQTIAENAKCPLSKIRVVVGPGIDVAHYQVDQKLHHRFVDKFGGAAGQVVDNQYRLDLKYCIKATLTRIGVPLDNIVIDHADTYTLESILFSYRRQGPPSGRMVTVVYRD